jgi:hypothetical protein
MLTLLIVDYREPFPIFLIDFANGVNLFKFHLLSQIIHLLTQLNRKTFLLEKQNPPVVLQEVLFVFTDGDCITWHGRMILRGFEPRLGD